MKHFFGILFLTIMLFAISAVTAEAQNQKLSFLVSGGVSLPVGDYGETIADDAKITRRVGLSQGDYIGLATTGYALGLEMTSPISLLNGLGWLISAKVIINPVNTEHIEALYNSERGDTITISLDYGNWLHIPVMSGFSYGYGISDDVNLYLTAQAGINVTQQASRLAMVDATMIENTEFDLQADFGFEFGFGVEFADSYNVSFRYLNLNTPRYKGTRELNPWFFGNIFRRESRVEGDDRKVEMFLVTLGYRI